MPSLPDAPQPGARLGTAATVLAVLISVAALVIIAGSLAPVPYAATPVPARGLPPLVAVSPPAINYVYYDWVNTDFQSEMPKAGPLGSLNVVPWQSIHVNDSQFDWTAIDSYLDAAQRMTVTLDSGVVIPKPVIIQIADNESVVPNPEVGAPYPPLSADSPAFVYADYTPHWLRDRLRAPIAPITFVTSLDPYRVGQISNDQGSYLAVGQPGVALCTAPVVAVAPKYNHPAWLAAYKQMVYALGKRYDGDSRISAVIFGSGIDGEYGQATKPFGQCELKSLLYQQSGMSEGAYLATSVRSGPLNDIADWYRDAFPSKSLFLQFTGAGKQMIDQVDAQRYVPVLGLKQATLALDGNNQWQSDGNGTIQVMQRFSTTHPSAWENAYPYVGAGAQGLQARYFTLLAGLTSFPSFMDFIGGWVVDPETIATGMFAFQRRYLGRSVTESDEIWVAMRDTSYWPPVGGDLKFAGWPDDFSYGLYRPDDIAGSKARLITSTALLAAPYNLPAATAGHIFALQDRRTDIAAGETYISLAADHRWPYWGKVPAAAAAGGVWYDVTLKYVDLGTDTLSVEYTDYGGITRSSAIHKSNTRQWVTTTVMLPDAYLNGQFPGGTDLRISADADRGGDEIVHMIMIRGHTGAAPTPTPVLARATPTPVPAYERRLNAGGATYEDADGHVWSADQAYSAGGWGFVGGNTFTSGSDIRGTPDQALYQSERWWPERGSYRFDAPNGLYDVELRFAETLRLGKGQRLFDVAVQGQPVLQGYDIFAVAGADTPVDMHVQAVVSDGKLVIDFVSRRDSAKVNAVHVTALGAAPAATPAAATATPVSTPEVGASRTPTATVTPTDEETIGRLEERYRVLDAVVRQLLELLGKQ